MKIKVAACQQPLHEPLSEALLNNLNDAHFVCLPEHYPLPQEIRSLEEAASRYQERKDYLAGLSQKLSAVIVGGTLTEKTSEGYYNTCYVFEKGHEIGSYRKVNPTPREISAGVLRGDEFKAFEAGGLRIGVLICADVLDEHSFDRIRGLDCDVTFVPTASPYRETDTLQDKLGRDRSIFLEGARRMNCPIVKTCGVGLTFGRPLQGRSLIATPEEIVARAEPHQENAQVLLTAELQL